MVMALFAVALGAGLRRDELARLPANALEGEELRVLGKGRKEFLQPLPAWALEHVRTWLAVRGSMSFELNTKTMFLRTHKYWLKDKEPTLWGTWNLITSVGEMAGLADFTPHDLRRTFASRMLERGDIALARRAMRHASAATTALYDRREDRAVAKAVASLEGFGFEVKRSK
jgi:integrase